MTAKKIQLVKKQQSTQKSKQPLVYIESSTMVRKNNSTKTVSIAESLQNRQHAVSSVSISGYPLFGYPDLSVNFMAAKYPDILK